ncbi:MAG TPA: Fic family protein [Noviherbaspirillum sp.]|uniref:Fic family protein n=1 Tax=Noviherbaspirillum sp. TaxID=1926288 RepID=UPI002D5612FA|nr:Fic family protein [Noviherbaspirillum sp.]HYD97322.1 Fic family protein [Noviherbaspirillum sp.]
MNLFCIEPDALLVLHQESLDGADANACVCDSSLLESALSHPLNEAEARPVDIADIAAAYAWGMLKYRPFAAGNERAALLAMGLFLYLNDWRLEAPPQEAARVIWQAATDVLDEADLANWIRGYL